MSERAPSGAGPERGCWIEFLNNGRAIVVYGRLDEQERQHYLHEYDRLRPLVRAAGEADAAAMQALLVWFRTVPGEGTLSEAHRPAFEAAMTKTQETAAVERRLRASLLEAEERLHAFKMMAYQADLDFVDRLEKGEVAIPAPTAPAPAPPPVRSRAAGYLAVVTKSPEGKGHVAAAPLLPGLSGAGGTENVALRRLAEAVPGYLAALRALGRPVPEPEPPDTPREVTPSELAAADRELAKPPRYRPGRLRNDNGT